MNAFHIRPGHGDAIPMIEFVGDHRSDDYPDVAALLAERLDATTLVSPDADAALVGLGMDMFISRWTYAGGEYDIDDSAFTLFVIPLGNRERVVHDVAQALQASGLFEQRDMPKPKQPG